MWCPWNHHSKGQGCGITPVVIKASAGAAAHLPIARVVNIANAIEP